MSWFLSFRIIWLYITSYLWKILASFWLCWYYILAVNSNQKSQNLECMKHIQPFSWAIEFYQTCSIRKWILLLYIINNKYIISRYHWTVIKSIKLPSVQYYNVHVLRNALYSFKWCLLKGRHPLTFQDIKSKCISVL